MTKQKQRGHGEGSIYQRKDGRWVAQITLEGRKRLYRYGETRKEAHEKLQKALHERKQGMLATGPQQTFNTYLPQWLNEVHKPAIRLATYVKYRVIVNRHLLPALGHMQVQKLTPQQVQTLYTHKLKEGLSPGSVRNIHLVLSKALDNAVLWNLVSRNVCQLVTPPRKQKPEVRTLTREQAQKLLETARGHRIEAMLTVALAVGMRRGELFGLKWQDIDFEQRCLHVRRTASYFTGKGFVESEPKTAKSRRTIMLPQFVIDVLKRHREQQAEVRLQAGETWQEHDLVFSNRLGGYFAESRLYHAFHKLLKQAGLPHMRFHDLRHSAATILLTMGAHPKIVQELLGHSQVGMTLDIYSHVIPSMQRDMMDKLDDMFRG